ncbi:MAG: AF1514 family protein [Deltaproteobacteria bacterium]|nr:AF1514 family protein [Deltaproteobacteria bacterium]
MTGRSCSIKECLNNPIELKIDDKDLDFASIKQLADNKAKEIASHPMLLAWYNGKTGDFVPKAECGSGPKPGWIVYAETRGGDIVTFRNHSTYEKYAS